MEPEIMTAARVVMAGGMAICAAMAIFWMFRIRSQGRRAFVMAPAFLVLGALMWAFLNEKPAALMIALGVILFILLAADIVMRSVQQVNESEKAK